MSNVKYKVLPTEMRKAETWKSSTTLQVEGIHAINVIKISTYKGYRGNLVTAICAGTLEDECEGFTCFKFMPFSDFNVLEDLGKARCTEKKITQLHQMSLLDLDDIVLRVSTFYANRVEE